MDRTPSTTTEPRERAPALREPDHPRTARAATAAAALLALALLPCSAHAQAAPLHLEFGVQGGVLSPSSELAEGDGITGGELEMTESFALGGHAGIQLPGGWMVEGAVATAPGTEVEGSGGERTGASFLSATGHLVYRLPIPFVEPFLGAGGGIRRFSFDDAGAFGSDGASDLAGVLLGGAYVTAVPGWRVRIEARDVIAGFEDPRTGDAELQNHLLFLAGVSWRIP